MLLRFGKNRADQWTTTREGGEPLGTALELSIDSAALLDRADVTRLLTDIEAVMVEDNWPPDMETWRYGVDREQQKTAIVKGSGALTTDIVVSLDCPALPHRLETIDLLSDLRDYILENYWTTGPSTLWTPTSLGAALVAWWSADTLSDGAVASWPDQIGGLAPAQAVGANQPLRSATLMYGRPAVSFDGIDDYLEIAATTGLPTGTATSETWAAGQSIPIAGMVAATALFGYGHSAANSGRTVIRIRNDGKCRIGDGTTSAFSSARDWDSSGDAGISAGPAVVGAHYTQTMHTLRFNGSSYVSPPAAMNTLTSRTRIGAGVGTTASGFWAGLVRHIMVTTALTVAQQLQLEGWLVWDCNIPNKLPLGHPYRHFPPGA